MGVRVRLHHGQHYVFINHRGKRKALRCGTEREANTLARKLQIALAGGHWNAPAPAGPPPTLREFVATWRDDTTIKSSTLRGYEANLDQHILPALGDTPLPEIDRTACKALLTTLRAKKPPLRSKTLANVIRTLSAVLSEAVERGYLAGNPAFRMGRYCRREGELPHEIEPLTREEAAVLLSAARDHFPQHYVLILTALRTGLRLGELLALEWGDIDFHGRFISVRRNRVAGKVTTPKSGKARRVDMSAQLAEALQRLHSEREAEARRAGHAVPHTVFLAPEGGPLDGDNLRTRVWEPLLERAGLRAIRFHDLRHTFASLLLAAGQSLVYVRDQLGHSSIKITVDTYGHLIPGANRAAVDGLDDEAPAPPRNPAQPDAEKGLQLVATTP